MLENGRVCVLLDGNGYSIKYHRGEEEKLLKNVSELMAEMYSDGESEENIQNIINWIKGFIA